jgi:hypothetical protein
VIDTARGAVSGRIAVGAWPVAVALAPQGKRLYTSNRGDHTASVVDLASGKEVKRIRLVRESDFAAVTPDGARVVVANMLPHGAGIDPTLAAEVSIVDAAALEEQLRIKLPAGSTAVTGATISPDGRWGYVIHTLGRFNLPITQLERGWVHTYALTILDLKANAVFVTLLLDDLTGGSADPWAVVRSSDGKRLWISHSGTHEVTLIDIAKVHELLDGKVPDELAKLKDGMRDNIWVQISHDRKLISRLANDRTDRRPGPTRPGPLARRKAALRGQLLLRGGGGARCRRRKGSGDDLPRSAARARRGPAGRDLLPRRYAMLSALAQLRDLPSRRPGRCAPMGLPARRDRQLQGRDQPGRRAAHIATQSPRHAARPARVHEDRRDREPPHSAGAEGRG